MDALAKSKMAAHAGNVALSTVHFPTELPPAPLKISLETGFSVLPAPSVVTLNIAPVSEVYIILKQPFLKVDFEFNIHLLVFLSA